MTDGGVHNLPMRAYLEGTDTGVIDYLANSLKFVERACTEFLRELGIESSLEAEQMAKQYMQALLSIELKLGRMTPTGLAARMPKHVRTRLEDHHTMKQRV